ncbi:hypothetical protein ACO0RG_004014 [Hanseniaspora osmophila]|mgnify:CR=1 FL=1|uniref:Importin beta SMX1 n=1 Tax=Hanseniaspora osmophila TaxID=56408 RepID=A0A1E5RBI3_9ASCO|nr:Importin beta SMX1 [Hanseniaspora osmophila]
MAALNLDSQVILERLQGTLQSDLAVIKQAEHDLYELQKQDGFCTELVGIVTNQELPAPSRISGCIYLKNKVQRSWPEKISLAEQSFLKDTLVKLLVQECNNNHLRPHLVETLRSILLVDQTWDLTDTCQQLLKSNDPQYTYAGILISFQISFIRRWDVEESRKYFDNFIESIFPILETMADTLKSSQDYQSNELLYLILKIFKYGCFISACPAYFKKDPQAFDRLITLFLELCKKPLPNEVMQLDPMDRSLDKRCKVQKWAYGNLSKMLSKYTRTTSSIDESMVNYVVSNTVPRVLEQYFQIMEIWSSKQLWLSESSLYNLITFLQKICVNDRLWPYIQPHLGTILNHFIVPCISSNEDTVLLYQEDPEEYIRKYFDDNKEDSDSASASSDFLYSVSHKRKEEIPTILKALRDIFASFDINNKESCYKQEAGLRILSTVNTFLTSGVQGSLTSEEFEGIYEHVLLPILALDGQYPFLVARALHCLSFTDYTFKNMDLLSKIFEQAYTKFISSSVEDDATLPLQIEGADALRSLILNNASIHDHIASFVPGMVEKLLKLSEAFEFEMLSQVIESLVENFSEQLKPFAAQLAENLANQYFTVGNTLVNGGDQGNDDQELLAASLISTMTTMVMSMPKVDMIKQFKPVVEFVIGNTQIEIMQDAMELYDSLINSSNDLYGALTEDIWNIYEAIVESFELYANDYFEQYETVFQSLCTYGFPKLPADKIQYVQNFVTIVDRKLDSCDNDFDITVAMNVLTFYTLSLNDIVLLPKCLDLYITYSAMGEDSPLDIEEECIIKLLLASFVVQPQQTLQLLQDGNTALKLFQAMFSCKFVSVFTLKLHILGTMNIFKLLKTAPTVVQGLLSQLSNSFISSIETLPKAIRKKDKMLKGEDIIDGNGFEDGANDEDDEDEFFDPYDDDFKPSAIDNVNVFVEIGSFFKQLPAAEPETYNAIISSLKPEKLATLKDVLEIVQQ